MGDGYTGNGATIAFTAHPAGPQAGGAIEGIGDVVSMNGFETSVEPVEDVHLLSRLAEYLPGDIITHDALTMVLRFDPEVQMAIKISDSLGSGTLYIATLTFPPNPDPTLDTPASLTGSGFLATTGALSLANDERSETEFSFQFDNKQTPIAFTPAASSP